MIRLKLDLKLLLIVIIFGLLMAFFLRSLKVHETGLPAAIINTPLEILRLPSLKMASKFVDLKAYRGEVFLINFFGSWCVVCLQEHPVLMAWAKKQDVPVLGIALNEPDRQTPQKWLQKQGNPYAQTAYDEDGSIGLAFGISGAPETFVIDAKGFIRYRHVGALSPEAVRTTLLPLIQKLRKDRGVS